MTSIRQPGRRACLALLGGCALTTALPRGATSLAYQTPGHRLMQESSLAGSPHYHGESLWPQRQATQPLTLRRRPDNPHDARAVEAHWDHHMLGHIPRLDNAATSQMLDRGQRLHAHIIKPENSTNPWQRVRIAVEL